MENKRFTWSAVKRAIYIALLAVGLTAMFALIPDGDSTFLQRFPPIFKVTYFVFGGSTIICALIELLFPKLSDFSYTYSMIIYYGTALIAYFLADYCYMELSVLFPVSAIVPCGICYIHWLQHKLKSK